MSWQQILKISRREASELGDKYAPEDMKQFRLEQSEKRKEDAKPALKQFLNELDSDKTMDEDTFKKIRNVLMLIVRDLQDVPKLRGKSREQLIEILKDYLGE